jgi:uncharacterized protein HemX
MEDGNPAGDEVRDRQLGLIIAAIAVAFGLAILIFISSCRRPVQATAHIAEYEAQAAQERAARQAEDAESERQLAAKLEDIEKTYRERSAKLDREAAERTQELQLKLDHERAKLRAIDARLNELQSRP